MEHKRPLFSRLLFFAIGLSKRGLTVCSCSSASTGTNEPNITRKAAAATFHLEDPMIFGESMQKDSGR